MSTLFRGMRLPKPHPEIDLTIAYVPQKLCYEVYGVVTTDGDNPHRARQYFDEDVEVRHISKLMLKALWPHTVEGKQKASRLFIQEIKQ